MEKGLAGIDYKKNNPSNEWAQWVILLLVVLGFAYFIFWYEDNTSSPLPNSSGNDSFGLAGSSNGALLTNFEYIDGLHSDLNLYDSWDVLNYVFSNLPERVVVYPSENYFYFRFTANGYNVKGSFALFARDRDEGKFGMGYIVYDENPEAKYETGRIGNGAEYSDANGVFVQKITDFEYDVTVQDKKVKFILNDVGVAPPQKAILLPEEKYIATSFDESGLKFFLIYNQTQNKVYWVLNEDGFVPEQFHNYLPSSQLVRGDRTDLVFFNDVNHSRKILIGAKGENVLANNWYDGPFDQLPDNYVKTGQINYDDIIRAYYAEGRVDQYLGYYEQEGARIAVAPYTVYFDRNYFDFVSECMRLYPADSGLLYACITVQQYRVPDDVYSSN